jgi:hypothetical protein
MRTGNSSWLRAIGDDASTKAKSATATVMEKPAGPSANAEIG